MVQIEIDLNIYEVVVVVAVVVVEKVHFYNTISSFFFNVAPFFLLMIAIRTHDFSRVLLKPDHEEKSSSGWTCQNDEWSLPFELLQ